jgi:outer membrane protein, multidrug efflux system
MRCLHILQGSLLVAILLLQGCALYGPDYTKPEVGAPEVWKSKDSLARVDGVPLPEMAWWDRFKDPALNDLIKRVLLQNNNVQAALGNLFQAQGVLRQIEMRWVPRVDAGAGYISVNDTNPITTAKLPFNSGFSAGFIPNYSINILQQLRTQEQAQANVAATRAAKNAVRLSVISQMVGSYFSLREEEFRLARQKDLVEALEEVVKKYTEAHKEGLISAFALRQYTLDLANARSEIPVIQYNIVRLGNTIHLLLNENPGPVVSGPDFMTIPYTSIISGNLPSKVLMNRPDVIAAEEQLRRSNANIGVNTSFFFPTISLTTPVGQGSQALSTLFTSPESYWQYQGGLSMPIVNLGQFGAIESAKGQYYTDYYGYQQTVRSAFAAVDSDFASHARYTESLEQMLEFYDTRRQRFENEETRHREGLVGMPEVLNLRVSMDQAGIEAAQTKLNQLLSIVHLYQDLGGGYAVENTEESRDLGDGHRFGDLF